MQSIYFKNHRGQRIGVIVCALIAGNLCFGASFLHPVDQETAQDARIKAKKQLAALRNEHKSSDSFITVPEFWSREDGLQRARANMTPALDFCKIPRQHRDRAAQFVAQCYRGAYRRR